MKNWSALPASLILLMVGCTGAPETWSVRATPEIESPSTDWAGVAGVGGVGLGMYLDDTRDEALAAEEILMGRHLDMLLTYRSIATDPEEIMLPNLLSRLEQRHTTLCLALEPDWTMRAIANGYYDDALRRWGAAIAKAKVTVWLRFASEMNESSNNWNPAADPVGNSPEEFKRAWIRAHQLISEELGANGASAIRWVFTPAAHPVSWIAGRYRLADFWPGRDYVDVIALDGYNQYGNGWRPFGGVPGLNGSVFEDAYIAAAALDPDLPMMIGETSCDRTALFESGGDRARWIFEAALQLNANYPRIRALNWFNANQQGHGYALSLNDGSYDALAAFPNVNNAK